jgi:hypothetical protein
MASVTTRTPADDMNDDTNDCDDLEARHERRRFKAVPCSLHTIAHRCLRSRTLCW